MTAATSRLRRRGIGAGVAALVGLTTLGFSASAAVAAPGFELERVGGADRFATAVQAAAQFEDTSSVVLVNGYTSIDALAASSLGLPILLTGQAQVPIATGAGLTALGVENITIVGGTSAVSAEQETALTALGFTVDRIAGTDRYDTAEQVSAELDPAEAEYAFVVNGLAPADALSASSVAAATGSPVVLVRPNEVGADATATLAEFDDAEKVVVGGEDRVSAAIYTAVGATSRQAGADRFATAAAFADWSIAQEVFDGSTAGIARGISTSALGVNDLADALVAGPVLGAVGGPLLLSRTTTDLGPVSTAWFTANADTLNSTGLIFGGDAVVAESVVTAAETSAEGGPAEVPPSNATLAVAPADATSLVLVENEGAGTTAEQNADNRSFSASGLTNGVTYRVTLVNADSITVGANGQVTFLASADTNSTTGFSANTGTPVATIASVNNNTTVNPGGGTVGQTAIVEPVNGNISFSIDGSAAGNVVPVVYVNGGAGGTATTGGTSIRLEVQATAAGQRGVPTESFGLGGATTFTAPAAQNGGVGTATVSGVDKTANSFTANQGAAPAVPAGAGGTPAAVDAIPGNIRTFTYDANDTFSVNGASVGVTAFKTALTSGDGISGTYAVDPAGVSNFQLSDTNPGTGPTAVAANGGVGPNSNDITVTANFGATDVDQVVIQRAPVTGTTPTAGTFATIATVPATDADTSANAAGTQISYVDNDVAVGSYQYRVAGVNDGQTGAFGPASATTQSVAPTGDTTAPTFTASTLTTDGGFADVLDSGDVFTIRFNEPMAVPAAGATLRIQDTVATNTNPSATIVDVIGGTNATYSLNAAAIPATPGGPNAGAAAGTVLTVTLTGAPTVVQAGTTPGVQFPATVVNTSGITDVAGNRVAAPTTDTGTFGPVGS